MTKPRTYLRFNEVQALVAGLAGLALTRGDPAGFSVCGSAPIFEDGCWREGFIVNPKRGAADNAMRRKLT